LKPRKKFGTTKETRKVVQEIAKKTAGNLEKREIGMPTTPAKSVSTREVAPDASEMHYQHRRGNNASQSVLRKITRGKATFPEGKLLSA